MLEWSSLQSLTLQFNTLSWNCIIMFILVKSTLSACNTKPEGEADKSV